MPNCHDAVAQKNYESTKEAIELLREQGLLMVQDWFSWVNAIMKKMVLILQRVGYVF